MSFTKEHRILNLQYLKVLEDIDSESAKLVLEDELINQQEFALLIQESIMLPKDHPLKISDNLIMKGLQQLLIRSCNEIEQN